VQALTTREGLQSMVDSGYTYMTSELASGRLDALLAAAPRRTDANGDEAPAEAASTTTLA
jgi:hypothetical protein